MGARQSKRSVDITTTPKKDGIPSEGGVVVGDAAAPGDGKLERIEETDTKPTTNGIAPHTEVTTGEDKEDKDVATEKDKEKPQDEAKAVTEESKQETATETSGDSPAEAAEVTTPTEANPASANATVTSPDTKEAKKKDKMKKKWSFRSISFSKKDKSKPAREDAPKNGDVTKEEPLAEGGEEAETAVASSPVEEKSAVSSPTEEEAAAASATATETATATATAAPAPVAAAAAAPAVTSEAKEEAASAAQQASSAASSPVEDKKEESTPPAPTPVLVEDKKEDVEKVEAEKKVVEVSPAAGGAQSAVSVALEGPVEVVSVVRDQQPVTATPSIIERKTSEDHLLLPSSLLPTSSSSSSPSSPPLAQATTVTAATSTPPLLLDTSSATTATSASQASPRVVVAPPSLIESKAVAIEDLPPNLPSSPPPTPIDLSPFQQAQQGAASATALAEALKLPAEAASMESSPHPPLPRLILKRMVVEVTKPCQEPSVLQESIVTVPRAPSPLLGPTFIESCPKAEAAIGSQVVESPPSCKAQQVTMSPSEVVRQEGRLSEGEVNEEKVEGEDFREAAIDSEVIREEEEVRSNEDVAVNEQQPSSGGYQESAETYKVLEVETLQNLAQAAATKDFVERVSPSEETFVEPSQAVVLDNIYHEELAPRDISKKRVDNVDVAKDNVESVEAEEDSCSKKVIVRPVASALVIYSEEGPLPLFDAVVEAKPALVVSDHFSPYSVNFVRETKSEESSPRVADSEELIAVASREKVSEQSIESEVARSQESSDPHEEENTSTAPESSSATTSEVSASAPKVTAVITGKSHVEEPEDSLPPPPPIPESPVPTLHRRLADHDSYTQESVRVAIDKVEELTSVLEPNESPRVENDLTDPIIDSTDRSRLSNLTCQGSLSSNVKDFAIGADESTVPLALSPSEIESIAFLSADFLPIPPPPPSVADLSQLANDSEDALVLEEFTRAYVPTQSGDKPANSLLANDRAPSPSNPLELPTPPRSPSIPSSISIASDVTSIATKDNSQILLYDDQSNREFKMESVSISLNSYNDSMTELKERLAESLAETENQKETLCQSLCDATPVAVQENHQSTVENEVAPVENNVAHDVSTTESVDEPPKIAPPAVPIEVPASPPAAPTITEDVASVTKAIEEIEISDKAVAAAVNEAMECVNTNEIIADARHQNNINE